MLKELDPVTKTREEDSTEKPDDRHMRFCQLANLFERIVQEGCCNEDMLHAIIKEMLEKEEEK